MTEPQSPSPAITVAMPAYQVERWIGEALESVLRQTSPPDEVVVVDDGSTDGTADVVRALGSPVRLVQQANRGASAAYNRAFSEAACEYVAMCPADDVWEAHKLECQRATLAAHPDVDVAFSGARYFGLEDRAFIGPRDRGVLDSARLFREMFEGDRIPAPTAVIRRDLFDRLGGFRTDLACEDYEFWMRALRAGAVFFHDPRPLARLRQHGGNLSSQALSMWEMNHRIHAEYAAEMGDSRLVSETLARDLRTIGRCRLGLGQAGSARQAYRASAAHVRHPSALAWAALLGVPGSGQVIERLAARRRASAT